MVAAGSITVAVRVRPPSASEAARLPDPATYDTTLRGDATLSTPGRVVNTATLRDIVQIVDDRILTFDPEDENRSRAFMERGFLPPGTKRYKDRRFMFDRVFGHEARQQDVYEATARPLLDGLLDGYNATVFAYGRIEDRKEEYHIEVLVTFLEIYNEEIRDLLAEPGSHMPRGGLAIREDKTVKVVGLTELKPTSADEVKSIVILGNQRRTQSPTHANATSSRSHAVLQVHVTQAPRTANLTEQRTMATLSIIDLAGSERASATMNMGQRMVEGANINKSLLALGNCINALCESGGATRHVPYRNSKLTRLLKFSLGGNCKTVMIVCVAPTSNHFDDTHNTLVYAERATKIKTKVVTRNVLNVNRHVGQYVEAIQRLNLEIAELKQKLAGKRATEKEIADRKKAEAKSEVDRARKDLDNRFEQTKVSIVDGGNCSAKVTVAKTKLDFIQRRLAQLDAEGSSGPADAERALLLSLATPEEDVLKPHSALNTRIQRASNSNAMFDATMRAVAERKSDKLDEPSIEIMKLETSLRRAEMEKAKLESERDAYREAASDMAEVMVKLLGMLGRCTVLIGDSATRLQSFEDPEVRQVATLLSGLREKNDETFQSLLGRTTESYSSIGQPQTLDPFQTYGASFNRRVSSGPAVLQHQQQPAKPTRRLSYGGALAPASPPRRLAHRSPRKSLRGNTAAPYVRKTSAEKDKKPAKVTKNVQWRDEAGQGSLTDTKDRTVILSTPPVVSIIPASPSVDKADSDPFKSANSSLNLQSPVIRPGSAMGSESEWEDDEKTDTSVDLSMSMSLSASTSSRLTSSARGIRRPRASRLDPSFLKSRTKPPSLSSLAEGDESNPNASSPLTDLNFNRMEDSSGSEELHIPKGRDRLLGSPGKRVPSTLKGGNSLSASTSSKPGAGAGTGSRRRSNIGPMRVEKTRRRSSLLAPLPPPSASGEGESISARTGPRRMLLASPAKRTKRASLTRLTAAGAGGSLRLKAMGASGSGLSVANLSIVDPANLSADLSMVGGVAKPKPSWR
ncbi:kinesin motor protein [Coprinopsis cinerea okayama7|uniref:Kinesin motor protein n=1 Tax=Coprinopsis cinerea (strain Okayama-7 / 130 / ATCC MYA-4618 / FGSC 9003) TaxID=240176 RepID=A8NWI3_COPC7|nr:kinesin motor protein [Coprinopsis cinerea okayama7\|eukprot:XP_001836899.2 kinesin motor protein [Coprinopsis cinerea okayama7\